jgi:hypothetical protein
MHINVQRKPWYSMVHTSSLSCLVPSPAQLLQLLLSEQRHSDAARAKAPCAPNPVRVSGGVMWQVQVDHQVDPLQVYAAGHDVGGDDHLRGGG